MEIDRVSMSMTPIVCFVGTITKDSGEMYMGDLTDWEAELREYTGLVSCLPMDSQMVASSRTCQRLRADYSDFSVSPTVECLDAGTFQSSMTMPLNDGSTGPCPDTVEL